MSRQPCKGRSRHWFREWGTGRTAPTCQECGAPNPKITAAELAEWEATRQPPTPFKWVRCYGVDPSTVEGFRAWCTIHEKRVNVGDRPERQGWHLYLVEGDP